MLKQCFLALAAISILFSSCKKSDPANEFIINGLHDVSFSSATSNILTLAVQQASGNQEQVTISVTGLPAGISADLQPAMGIPAFGSIITFTQSGVPTPGTYPIHIVGTSASYTKSYDVNLSVSSLNGFLFGGKKYVKSTFQRYTTFNPAAGDTGQSIVLFSTDNGQAAVSLDFYSKLPTADGTYTYNIGGYRKSAVNIVFDDFSVGGGTGVEYRNNVSDSSKTATLLISGGKATIRVNSVQVSSWSSGSKELIVDAGE